MRKQLLLIMLAIFPLCASAASTNSHLKCSSSTGVPDADLIGFDFNTTISVSSGSGGGGAGKAESTVTVQLPLNSSFDALYKLAVNGTHISSCVLTKPISSTVTVTLDLTNVVFSNVELVSGPFFANNTTAPFVALKLSFQSITVE